jgi:hypothetical protein
VKTTFTEGVLETVTNWDNINRAKEQTLQLSLLRAFSLPAVQAYFTALFFFYSFYFSLQFLFSFPVNLSALN